MRRFLAGMLCLMLLCSTAAGNQQQSAGGSQQVEKLVKGMAALYYIYKKKSEGGPSPQEIVHRWARGAALFYSIVKASHQGRKTAESEAAEKGTAEKGKLPSEQEFARKFLAEYLNKGRQLSAYFTRRARESMRMGSAAGVAECYVRAVKTGDRYKEMTAFLRPKISSRYPGWVRQVYDFSPIDVRWDGLSFILTSGTRDTYCIYSLDVVAEQRLGTYRKRETGEVWRIAVRRVSMRRAYCAPYGSLKHTRVPRYSPKSYSRRLVDKAVLAGDRVAVGYAVTAEYYNPYRKGRAGRCIWWFGIRKGPRELKYYAVREAADVFGDAGSYRVKTLMGYTARKTAAKLVKSLVKGSDRGVSSYLYPIMGVCYDADTGLAEYRIVHMPSTRPVPGVMLEYVCRSESWPAVVEKSGWGYSGWK